jgi:hypothetical protein
MQFVTVLVLKLHYNMQNWLEGTVQFYFNTNTVMSNPTKYVTKNYNVVLRFNGFLTVHHSVDLNLSPT